MEDDVNAGADSSDSVAQDQRSQQMPMALLLVLIAVAHQCHSPLLRQPLDQPKRELLAVILDGPATRVDGAVQEHLTPEFA